MTLSGMPWPAPSTHAQEVVETRGAGERGAGEQAAGDRGSGAQAEAVRGGREEAVGLREARRVRAETLQERVRLRVWEEEKAM